MRSGTLTRHTPLPRPSRPMRRSKLRNRSPRQSRLEREWSRLKRQAIAERGDVCEVCRVAPAEHAHHKAGRLRQTIEMLLLVCRACHRAIHGSPEASYAAGYMVRRNVEVSA